MARTIPSALLLSGDFFIASVAPLCSIFTSRRWLSTASPPTTGNTNEAQAGSTSSGSFQDYIRRVVADAGATGLQHEKHAGSRSTDPAARSIRRTALRGPPRNVQPWHLADIVWAYSRFNHYHSLFHEIPRALLRLPKASLMAMGPDHVVKLAVGYAKMKIYEPKLFDLICEIVNARLAAFSPTQLTQVLACMAEVRHGLRAASGTSPTPRSQDRALLLIRNVSQRILQRPADFPPQELVTALVALSELQHMQPPLATGLLACCSLVLEQGSLSALDTPLLVHLAEVCAAYVDLVQQADRQTVPAREHVELLMKRAAAVLEQRAPHVGPRSWQRLVQAYKQAASQQLAAKMEELARQHGWVDDASSTANSEGSSHASALTHAR
mmetsp:Transcript_26063/g.56907  ORF Transcript_26063/g.56907 Transcript_26063/m.56907 type:complete len:383 (-) Transcript_26063:257-1405(-)|eukprot:CAMPEP_0202901384 /NCGR_PEP_ID=MMETSP1392-20130828/14226_1 /ASSEMBLY_ACC=CAM_ASM_000868 /TAXON_ID=225041 /ORGANISM="Chlamydomonas chlamydogama, Strain SAG 11-48b" /LENGTH=382 /DNA_ID=CAMNT_0049587941 /DNA_START=66 /DNA_END=1214 /DNA_ORIENTATION=+